MNTPKTATKVIPLLLFAVMSLSSCTFSETKSEETSKTTSLPIIPTQISEIIPTNAATSESQASIPTSTVSASQSHNETTYILNTNTKKFHFPSCSSIDNMKEKNKREFTGNSDELILQGYVPCKICIGK